MSNKTEIINHLELLEALEKRIKYNKYESIFPDEGRYRRDLYPKAIAFFNAGSIYNQRLLSGGNRTGKTTDGATEMTAHLTGIYHDWWKGKKFLNPIKALAAGISSQVVKEVMQEALLGPMNDIGSGLIPKDLIIDYTRKAGIANAIETVRVKHISGGISILTFKSYEQGREDFQGTKKDVIWLDEEPRDYELYAECLMRTMDDVTPGILFMTFTPLFGLSKIVLSFLKDGRFSDDGINPDDSGKWATQIGWDDIPHLSEQQKKELLKSIAPHLRDARTKGLPHLGGGAIYPYPEDDLIVDPFPIPEYWPKAYGLDVGGRTAVIWAALDPDSGIYYLYSEYYRTREESDGFTNIIPAHASAIKSRGSWIPGVIDTGALSTHGDDGMNIYQQYIDEGLNLEYANKGIESGILKMQQLFASSRMKVFTTCNQWIQEFRTYRRDEKTGKVADKQKDDMMDATRYLIMGCPDLMELEPDPDKYRNYRNYENQDRDNVTGY